MKKTLLGLLLVTCLALGLGCQKKDAQQPPSGEKKLSVVTTLFPLYDFARNVAGDKAEVVLLLPPGIEPHSYEPTPNDMVRLTKADVVVFTNEGMEPWAAKLLRSLPSHPATVDSSTGAKFRKASPEEEHDHGAEEHDHDARDLDPHIWLDFANAQVMVNNIAEGLAEKDPANRDYYQKRAAAYRAELKKLDDQYRIKLANCRKRFFLHGGHYAFGYLAGRYDLTYRSAQALSPDAEATPERVAALVRLIRKNGVKYVYTEELLSPTTAEMLAKETGVQVLKLNGAHNVSKEAFRSGVSFIALMEKNLENLRKGLECK